MAVAGRQSVVHEPCAAPCGIWRVSGAHGKCVDDGRHHRWSLRSRLRSRRRSAAYCAPCQGGHCLRRRCVNGLLSAVGPSSLRFDLCLVRSAFTGLACMQFSRPRAVCCLPIFVEQKYDIPLGPPGCDDAWNPPQVALSRWMIIYQIVCTHYITMSNLLVLSQTVRAYRYVWRSTGNRPLASRRSRSSEPTRIDWLPMTSY